MLDKEQYNPILEAYFNGSEHSLSAIAKTHGVSLEDCRREWQKLGFIGQNYANSDALGPSSITIGKILAHAREAAEADLLHAARTSFWKTFFKPSYAFATAAAAVIVVVMALQTMPIRLADQVAMTGREILKSQESLAMQSTHQVSTLPLYVSNTMPGLNAGVRKYNLLGDSSFATTVSYGTEDQSIALGSEIDRKAMAGSLLEEKDLEILFYRARKAERQGRFQEALRDYQFIAKFYPDYQDRKIIQLAVANCLDSLEQNDKAILVLQQFENSYGSSEEIDLWIDELKSVTF